MKHEAVRVQPAAVRVQRAAVRVRRAAAVYALPALLVAMGAAQGCDAQVATDYAGEPLLRLQGSVEALASRVGADPSESPGEAASADVGVLWFTSSAGAECSGPEPSCLLIAGGTTSAETDFDCLAACDAVPECTDVAAIERWQSCNAACGSPVDVQHELRYRACATGAVGQRAPVMGAFPAQFGLDVLLPPPDSALLASDTGERLALGYFVAIAPGAEALDVVLEEGAPAWLIGGSETHVLVYAADAIAAESIWGQYLGEAFAPGYHLLRVEFGNRCGLPRLYADTSGGMFSPDPDEEGLSDLVPPPADEAPASDSPQPDSPQPDSPETDAPETDAPPPDGSGGLRRNADYRGTPLVCGNGVCEQNETCDICSDCVACDGGAPGQSSGRTNLDDDYHCFATPSRLVPTPAGSETDIQLLIARPDLIAWPEL